MSVEFKGSTSGITGNSAYESYTTTTAYVQRVFTFPVGIVSLINDSLTDSVQISWDGTTQIYNLKPQEYVDIPAHGNTSIYIKATAGGGQIRIILT